MAYCVIPNCGSKLQDKRGVSFHEFPCRGQRREEWIRVVQAARHCGPDDPWYPTEKSRVCSRHFLPTDYRQTSKMTLLSKTAIPSVFPGQPGFPAGKDVVVSRHGRLIKRTFVIEKKKIKTTTADVASGGETRAAAVSASAEERANQSAGTKVVPNSRMVMAVSMASVSASKNTVTKTVASSQTVVRRRPPNILRVSRLDRVQKAAVTAPEMRRENAILPERSSASREPQIRGPGSSETNDEPLAARISGDSESLLEGRAATSSFTDAGTKAYRAGNGESEADTFYVVSSDFDEVNRMLSETRHARNAASRSSDASSKLAPRQRSGTVPIVISEPVDRGRCRSVGCQTSITCHAIDNQRNQIADLMKQYEALQMVVHEWEVKNAELAKEVYRLRPPEASAACFRPRETTLFIKEPSCKVKAKKRPAVKTKSTQKVARVEEDAPQKSNASDTTTEVAESCQQTSAVCEERSNVGTEPSDSRAAIEVLEAPEGGGPHEDRAPDADSPQVEGTDVQVLEVFTVLQQADDQYGEELQGTVLTDSMLRILEGLGN